VPTIGQNERESWGLEVREKQFIRRYLNRPATSTKKGRHKPQIWNAFSRQSVAARYKAAAGASQPFDQ